MMMDPTFEKELHEQLSRLDAEQQRCVIDFAPTLATKRASEERQGT
jgi:hypothetical protein